MCSLPQRLWLRAYPALLYAYLPAARVLCTGLLCFKAQQHCRVTCASESPVCISAPCMLPHSVVPCRCGHCKKLAPEYETAAGQLKGEGITLAKVDATEDDNKDLASKFGIQGFPTLKIFRGSEDSPTEYEGPRESAGIVSHLKKQFGPAFKEIKTEDEVKAATNPSDDISVVGVFPKEGDGLKAFQAAAESLRNDATFVYVSDAKLVKDADGKEGVLLYRDFDEKMVKYDGKLEKVSFCPALLTPTSMQSVGLSHTQGAKHKHMVVC